jgi:hypothetical protein
LLVNLDTAYYRTYSVKIIFTPPTKQETLQQCIICPSHLTTHLVRIDYVWGMAERFSYLLILLIVATSAQSKCDCNLGDSIVSTFSDSTGRSFIVCGSFAEQIDSSTIEINTLTFVDCRQDTVIQMSENDEISRFQVSSENDTLAFSTTIYLPLGENWEVSTIPLMKQKVYRKKGVLEFSESVNVFSYPTLSTQQTDSIRTLCKELSDALSLKEVKNHYPLPYETIPIVFVGAFFNIGDSRMLFKNMRANFEFDGAAAETLAELSVLW